jgi:ribosomal protein L7Ae-like RNA K-turn-binding protein
MNDTAKHELLGFLGLLYVGKKALIGEELTSRLGKVKLLIKASDATSNQALGLKRKAINAHIPFVESFTKDELGAALGHNDVTYIGIIDEKAAGAYLKKLTGGVQS